MPPILASASYTMNCSRVAVDKVKSLTLVNIRRFSDFSATDSQENFAM